MITPVLETKARPLSKRILLKPEKQLSVDVAQPTIKTIVRPRSDYAYKPVATRVKPTSTITSKTTSSGIIEIVPEIQSEEITTASVEVTNSPEEFTAAELDLVFHQHKLGNISLIRLLFIFYLYFMIYSLL